MFLKMMAGIDKPDSDSDKPYRLIECKEVEFSSGALTDGLGWARVDGLHIPLTGNAYILNNAGKTVDSYWARAKQ